MIAADLSPGDVLTMVGRFRRIGRERITVAGVKRIADGTVQVWGSDGFDPTVRVMFRTLHPRLPVMIA